MHGQPKEGFHERSCESRDRRILRRGCMPSESNWQSNMQFRPRKRLAIEDALKQKLITQGWSIRRIKIDGGCYEVYGVNEKGERVETYFHPVTFDHVLTTTR
jgi:Peptidase propeptide and YPEB domain